MRCNTCNEEAVVFQDYSGKYLCKRHFVQDLEAKAKHAIRQNQWIQHGDHIGVAMNGSSGSGALLYFLHKTFAKRRDIRLSAIIYKDCPETAVSLHNAQQLNIPVTYVSRAQMPEQTMRPEGLTKIACPNTLDDEAFSVFKSILLGVPDCIFNPVTFAPDTHIPLISPFAGVPATEIRTYADIHHVEYLFQEKSAENSLLRAALDDYTSRHPATKFSLKHLGESIKALEASHHGA